MSKKKKQFKETTIEDYYDLKIDKVDELVAALKDGGDQPETEVNYEMNANMGVDDPKNVTRRGKQRKFNPYSRDKLSAIPTWIKAIFVKWWFAGVVCYFIMWGLSIRDPLDLVVIVGVVLGLIVDIMVNPAFNYMQSDEREYDPYIMFPFPFKAFWTLFANILYYLLVIYIVSQLYFGLNTMINVANGTEQLIHVGVEPLLFGTFTVIVDMAFIGIKDGIVALVRRQKNKKKEGAVNV